VLGAASSVTPSEGLHCVCYCDDCQAFAHFLGRPDVLDAAGGTDIFHMPAGRVKFISGIDALRCLSFNRSTLRWYADCCRTPIGNTAADPRVPVVGIIHSFMNFQESGRSEIEVLGPPLCRIYEGYASGPLPMGAAPRPSLRVFGNRVSKALSWWLRGLGRPNPFFDQHTKAPLRTPELH
jgi:hypothetical protein